VLGRTTAGTLRLREDERGLAVEIDPPDTQVARDLMISIDRGDIDGMSFRFTAVRQEWDDSAEPPLRTIYEMELDEVSVVTFPQYDDTTVGLRSLDESRKERRQHNFSAAARRLRMKTTLDLIARSKA
jgi:HK97 family phage prohead protease